MIPNSQPHLLVTARTHPGESGKNNEDSYTVTSYTLGSRRIPSVLAIVADGIGGHQAGEIASRLTVDTVVRRLEASGGHEPLSALRTAILQAGKAIAQSTSEAPEREGMGSTIAAAWIIGQRLYTASIGDSRIYLRRDGRLSQISIDHTWIQEALDHDIISPEEAKDHPHQHVLRRHIGGKAEPQPDFRLRLSALETDEQSRANQGLRLNPGDQLLLCSDGLSDLVENHELEEALGATDPEQAAVALVDLARARGGHDNITLIILQMPQGARTAGRPKARIASLLILLAGLGAIALLAIGVLLYTLRLWPFSTLRDGQSGGPVVTSLAPAMPTPVDTSAPAFSTPAISPTPGPTSTAIPLATVAIP
jgi:PPM family protein phosphatase